MGDVYAHDPDLSITLLELAGRVEKGAIMASRWRQPDRGGFIIALTHGAATARAERGWRPRCGYAANKI
ncbi:glucose-1-phosphate thymidylyltransferase [Edwardsiella piscicida]|nr:glucose-1-phosphate thymidylyltransferase [Edwardsiella piscicida]